MIEYKDVVKQDGAVAFWTFENEEYDERGKLIVPENEPLFIIDEIDNKNPGIMIGDEDYLGYRLGTDSLIEFESNNNKSITFGYYGYYPQKELYPTSYVYVAHSDTFLFKDSCFTIEFLFNIPEIEEKNEYNGYYPLFVKSNVIEILFHFNLFSVNSEKKIVIKNAQGQHIIDNILETPLINWLDKTIHFVVTQQAKKIANKIYEIILLVYVNSRIIKEVRTIIYDKPYYLHYNTEITIGGGSGYSQFKFPCIIDQVAVYNKALTSDEVARHTKKCFSYKNLIKNCYASNMWPFDDSKYDDTMVIKPYIGNFNGKYTNDNIRVKRELDGPDNILLSKSSKLSEGAAAHFVQSEYQINHSFNQYTYEWWFTAETNNPGVLFSFQEFEYPFKGSLVLINYRDNQYVPGSIQFSEANNDSIINSKIVDDNGHLLRYNDGKWHHIAITKNLQGKVKMYLDGDLCGEFISKYQSISQRRQITMMNGIPGYQYVNGHIAFLAYYIFPLQEHQIKSRFAYSVFYKIKGIVLLMGVPHKAKLRFYSSYSGRFLLETESDNQTGEYDVNFFNKTNVDIFVFTPDDLSIRYRAYGPIIPSKIEDYHKVF